MGCEGGKERVRQEIRDMSNDTVKDEDYEEIIDKMGYEPIEVLNLYKKFARLKPDANGIINYYQMLKLPYIKYSPFGYHFLEVFGLNDVVDEIECEEKRGDELFQLNIQQIPNNCDKIDFKRFCNIIYYFTDHAAIDDKCIAYFRLFDFDNDYRISVSDIETYLNNLNKSVDELVKVPEKPFTTIRNENEDERKISNANLLTFVEQDAKAKNQDEHISLRKNIKLDLNANNTQTENNKIAEMIIKEAEITDKKYLNYLDFKFVFMTSNFIKDYSHNIYLYKDEDD